MKVILTSMLCLMFALFTQNVLSDTGNQAVSPSPISPTPIDPICATDIVVGHIALQSGDVLQARQGDMLCVLNTSGGFDCGDAIAASTSYSCPNGSTAGCATECNRCATGTGTANDCKACCDHFHSGASAISCKRNFC